MFLLVILNGPPFKIKGIIIKNNQQGLLEKVLSVCTCNGHT